MEKYHIHDLILNDNSSEIVLATQEQIERFKASLPKNNPSKKQRKLLEKMKNNSTKN